jgi:hypothetical protein
MASRIRYLLMLAAYLSAYFATWLTSFGVSSLHSSCGIHSPKRFVNFVADVDGCGRWAPAVNNENFRYRKQAPSAIVIGIEIICTFWDSVATSSNMSYSRHLHGLPHICCKVSVQYVSCMTTCISFCYLYGLPHTISSIQNQ